MRTLNVRRVLAALAVVAVLPLLTACPGGVGQGSSSVEHEDCDAEDRANREAECGFTKTKSTSKPKPAKTSGKKSTTKKGKK